VSNIRGQPWSVFHRTITASDSSLVLSTRNSVQYRQPEKLAIVLADGVKFEHLYTTC
jgi:hypothetical protein